MLREARPLGRRLALAIALGACAIGAGIGLMSTAGYLISKSALAPPILSLGVAIGLVQFFGLSRAVFRYAERLLSHDTAFRFLRELRVAFYERLEPLVPGGLGTARSGDLLSRFVADVEAMQFLFLRALAPPLVALVVSLVAVAVAAIVLPAAAAVLAAGLALGGIGAAAITGRAARAGGLREAPARAELASDVVEALAATPELVAFGALELELERIAAADKHLGEITTRQGLIAGFGEALVLLSGGITLVATLALAAPAVAHDSLGGVWLGMLALLVLASFEAVRSLPLAAQHLSGVKGAAARLFELADRPVPARDPEHPLPIGEARSLRLEGARLRYGESGPWVLDGVSFELKRGRRVALVGQSGSGKTTIARVLVRFRELDSGRATLNGQDLSAYAQDDLRALVALAGQEAHLFSTSVRENIRFARPSASDEEIAAALRRAGAWDWVSSLPDGLDTYVGESGDEVSGGERQRIALARAFLSGAAFLILDEPTAHLDRRSATEIIDDLFKASGDAGLLVITHDDYAIDRFDQVLRLEGGKIATSSAA